MKSGAATAGLALQESSSGGPQEPEGRSGAPPISHLSLAAVEVCAARRLRSLGKPGTAQVSEKASLAQLIWSTLDWPFSDD